MSALRRLAALVATLLVALVLVSAGPAAAQEGDSGSSGGDNVAIALNTKDGSSLFKYAFSVTKATGEVVDAGNAAVASASCTECSTIAVAVQFVIVEGSPDVFTPENLAIAVNQSCTLCETMALAYQIVIQTDGPVRLTGEGRQQLHDLLQQLRDLDDPSLSLEEVHARVEDLVGRMTQVLSTQLVPIGQPHDAPAAVTTTTTVRDSATTTSTTEAVRSTTTTSRSGSTTTTSNSTPSSTTTSTSTSTTSTTAP